MAKQSNCNSPLLRSLQWCQGKPQRTGLKRRIYFQSKQNIVKYPTLPKDELGRVTSSILEGNFELAADQKWHCIDHDPARSTLTSDAQGDIPSQTQLNKLQAVLFGIDEDAAYLAAMVNNADNVYIVEDFNGKARVVGNEHNIAKSTVAQDIGQQSGSSAASTTLNVEVTDDIVPPFYVGTLETEDGTVDFSGSPKE